MRQILLLSICFALVICICSPGKSQDSTTSLDLPKLPDLDVTYISQRPLYVGYWIDYPNDVPTFWVADEKSPGGRRAVSREEWEKLTKYQHAPGDKVTFTAHVRNNGFVSSPETDYKLYIDGELVDKGRIKPLNPDEEQPISYDWIYKDGRHTISLEVDTNDKVKEICEVNNRLIDPTYGIGLTIRAWDEANYRGFRSTPNMWGSYSFEDWCQAHIMEWRRAFREAIYPATPQGILQGIRFDGIFTSLEDPALIELRKALRDSIERFGRKYDKIPVSERDWLDNESCSWRINWDLKDIPNYAKRIDLGLIHELCHQCGIIDLYQFGMHMNQIMVTDTNGHFIWNEEGCYHQFGDLMAVAGENSENPLAQRGLFLEHTAAAFNSEMGKGRWGFGLYLFDLPKHNILRVLDNRGRPIPNAEIRLYQQEINNRVVGSIPPKIGRTDANGEWDMGSRPIDKIHVVGTNGIMLIEILAYGQWEFHTLVISEMNIAYWRGDKDRHVYEMLTGIAPPDSLPAPRNLKVTPIEGKKVRLTWDYPDNEKNIHRFLVLKRDNSIECCYAPAFEKVAAAVWSNEKSVELEATFRTLFVVVAVDQMGNRSGYSNIAVYPSDEVLPKIDRVFGVTQTPDGSIYVLNTDVATIFGLTPKGGRINLGNKVIFDAPETCFGLASDSKGILYVPNPKGGYIYRVDPNKQTKLDNLTCSALSAPRGISIDSEDNLYVSDVTLRKIFIINKNGELLGEIDAGFNYPRYVFVDKKGSVYVADCRIIQQWRESLGAVYVFKRNARGFSYTQALKIEGLRAVECVIADDQGRIYVGGYEGIYAYDKDGKQISHWISKPYGTPMGAGMVGAFAWDKNGDLLVTWGFTLRQLIRCTKDEILTAKPQP